MKTDNLKLIESYFNGQMNESERNDFENRLSKDHLLKAEYDEYLAIYEAIGDRETLEIRRSLKKIGEEFSEKKSKKGGAGNINSWFWLAALLIVSISFISVTYMFVNSPVARQVFGLKLGAYSVDNNIYRLDPAYAEAIRYRVRSEDFHLEVPKDSLVIEKNTEIPFRWHTVIDSPITLDVMNKYGKVIYSSKKDVRSPFFLEKKLPQGIYIFRFRTETATLYTGLFYII